MRVLLYLRYKDWIAYREGKDVTGWLFAPPGKSIQVSVHERDVFDLNDRYATIRGRGN